MKLFLVCVLVQVPQDKSAFGASARLQWQTQSGVRTALLPEPQPPFSVGFSVMPPESTHISFTNILEEHRGITNSMLFNGSGVAAGDVDGDGRCDLFFCGLGGRSALFRNLGDWKFTNITAHSGLDCRDLDATSSLLLDVDGDRAMDLIVSTFGQETRVFRNDGQGHFSQQVQPSALNSGKAGMTMAAGDLDGDGDLDLYVTNYRTTALADMPQTKFWLKTINGKQVISTVNGRPVTDPDLADRYRVSEFGGIDELGESDALFLNQGDGRFTPVSFTTGRFLDEEGVPLKAPPYEWGLSVMIRDLNQDGRCDIYVCNDFDSPDRVWINQGKGTFRALPQLAMRKTSHFSMGVDVADINRDGWDDIFVLDMLSREHRRRMNFAPDRKAVLMPPGEFLSRPQYARNTLSLNRGDGTYAEIACYSGLDASEWSWAAVFLDVDLDGWEDLLITNGNERDGRNLDVADELKSMRAGKTRTNQEILEARKLFPRLATSNIAFRNRGDLTFEDTSDLWGFNLTGVSHGMALADLDNDGDQDVAINNLNQRAEVYRNNTPAGRVWLRVRGKAPNTAGIGARLKLEGGPVSQSQEIISGGRYLSSDDPARAFATGTNSNPLTLTVRWPLGGSTVISNVMPNRAYEVEEIGQTRDIPAETKTEPTPFFEDVSLQLGHRHTDVYFDDFERQPLMERKLSQLGPGAAWFDVDRDGWEDLVVPGGQGGRLEVRRNHGRGGFEPWELPSISGTNLSDQASVLLTQTTRSEAMLIVAICQPAEARPGMGGLLMIRTNGASQVTLADWGMDPGPMAMGDVNGDGTPDLFVGGRNSPGNHPRPASSKLLLRVDDRLEEDAERSAAFKQVGLVSGAVFTDLTGDGVAELVLACEWGPLRIFENQGGRLQEVTEAWGMDRFKGWWNGVSAGDFDGDGRLDLVASNWGSNHGYHSHATNAIRLYYGDINGEGRTEGVEAWHDRALGKWVPIRMLDVLARRLPFLRERFPNRDSYAQASVEGVLGDRLAHTQQLAVNWMESTVFLNRGDRFEVRRLPMEAQWSPAFGICVGDLDGDGQEDLFLSQNFFGSNPPAARDDAGRGLWLKGDGRGGFQAVSGQRSGVVIYGEQRACALADYDHDGRVDLAVCQNGATTRLFRNVQARPGLRLRLVGPAANPTGVGAVIRWGNHQGLGPAREIRAGGGYRSQDAPVQILGGMEAPTRIWVRWPGGKVTETVVPEDGRHEMEIHHRL